MAKKIYNVTLANGTVQEVSTKKAVLALEGITSVTVNGEDVTSQFINNSKEETGMEEIKNTEAQVAEEAIEVVEIKDTEAPVAIEDIPTLLFTASRGNSRQFNWYEVVVNPTEEKVKVKGCAIEVPKSVADTIGTDKFVSWIPMLMAQNSVTEDKPVRGMASTFSDVFARYCKVNEVKGADKVKTVLTIFKDILKDIEAGTTSGGWTRPEPIKEEAPKAEEPAQEEAPISDAEIISTDLADIEVAG